MPRRKYVRGHDDGAVLDLTLQHRSTALIVDGDDVLRCSGGPSNRSVVLSASGVAAGYTFEKERPRTRVAADVGGPTWEAIGATTGNGGKLDRASTFLETGKVPPTMATLGPSFSANRAPLASTITTREPLSAAMDAPSVIQS